MSASTRSGSGVAAPRLVRLFDVIRGSRLVCIRWRSPRSNPRPSFGDCGRAQWRPYSSSALRHLQRQLAETLDRMHRPEIRECPSGYQSIQQWAVEAAGSIDTRGYKPNELLHIARWKTIARAKSLLMLRGTNPSCPPGIPRSLLAFLDDAAARILLHPSCEDFEQSNWREVHPTGQKRRRLSWSGWPRSSSIFLPNAQGDAPT
jgi:hypothetical protein